jgi:hypothetical protein
MRVVPARHFGRDVLVVLAKRAPTSESRCPRQDSNLRTRLRRPALYPLSYEGGLGKSSNAPPRDRGLGSA